MKKFLLILLLVPALVAAHGQGHTPVVICHNGHTITVDDDAVPAHLAHGDTLGPCVEPTDEPTQVVTDEPTIEPTEEPTSVVTGEPTSVATEEPTQVVTEQPTVIEPTKEVTAPPASATDEPFRALPVCEAWSVVGTSFSWQIFLNGAWQTLTNEDGSDIVTPVEHADRYNDVIGTIEPNVAFTRLVITGNMPEIAALYRTTSQSERWIECHDGIHSVDQR